MAVAARVERAGPEGTSRLERDGLSKCPTLPLSTAAISLLIFWWGWRDLNSHARRRWFLRPVCLPISPHPHDLVTTCRLDTRRASRLISTNLSAKWWPLRDSNPEGVTALEAAASANSAKSPPKNEKPLDFRGAFVIPGILPKSAAPLHAQQIAE